MVSQDRSCFCGRDPTESWGRACKRPLQLLGTKRPTDRTPHSLSLDTWQLLIKSFKEGLVPVIWLQSAPSLPTYGRYFEIYFCTRGGKTVADLDLVAFGFLGIFLVHPNCQSSIGRFSQIWL